MTRSLVDGPGASLVCRSQKSLAGPGLPKGVFRASMIGETKHRAISPGAFSVADRC
jgi:hypothetical protein